MPQILKAKPNIHEHRNQGDYYDCTYRCIYYTLIQYQQEKTKRQQNHLLTKLHYMHGASVASHSCTATKISAMSEIKSKQEIEILIERAKELVREQNELQQKFNTFYFGIVHPFEIVYTDFETFKSFFNQHPPTEISIKKDQLSFEIIAAEIIEPKRIRVDILLLCQLGDEAFQFYNDLRKTIVLR
jgi:hypothetical protein